MLPPPKGDDPVDAEASSPPSLMVTTASLFWANVMRALCPRRRSGRRLSSRYQDDFDRPLSLVHHVDALLKIGERHFVRDHALWRQAAVADRVDGERITIRAEMGAIEIELLAVADDAPIDRDFLAEHAELDEAAALADHVQTLLHALG